MHQVLLVDDEAHVADMLELCIPWATLGVGAVHKASSGEEALAFLGENPVDLVITDIEMQGMNGLELIEKAKLQAVATKWIILSGHHNFGFAQKAIRQEITAYLLKPVRESEMEGAVKQALERLRDEWTQLASWQRTEQTLRDHLPLLRARLLGRLIQGNVYTSEALQAQLRQLQMKFKPGDTCQLWLLRTEGAFERMNEADMDLMEYAITNMAEELAACRFRLWCGRDGFGQLVFLLFPTHSQRIDEKESDRLALQLQHAVKLYLRGSLSIVSSAPVIFPAGLAKALSVMQMTLREEIGAGQDVFLRTGSRHQMDRIPSSITLNEPPSLTVCLEMGKWNEAESKVKAVIEEAKLNGLHSQEYMMELFYALASHLTSIPHKMGLRWQDCYSPDDTLRLKNGTPFNTWNELELWACRLIGGLEKRKQESRSIRHGNLIEAIHMFIEQHLHTGISLQSIADHVGLHPVYLSNLYKSLTGQVLTQYLLNHRLELAAQALLQSGDKVYEISSRLGYVKPQSFIRVFRERFGMTPQEYREKHSRGTPERR